jgi:hypothetical protein
MVNMPRNQGFKDFIIVIITVCTPFYLFIWTLNGRDFGLYPLWQHLLRWTAGFRYRPEHRNLPTGAPARRQSISTTPTATFTAPEPHGPAADRAMTTTELRMKYNEKVPESITGHIQKSGHVKESSWWDKTTPQNQRREGDLV